MSNAQDGMPRAFDERIAELERRVAAAQQNAVRLHAEKDQRIAFLEGAMRVVRSKLAAHEESHGYHRRTLAELLACIQGLGRIAGIPEDRFHAIPDDPDDLPTEAPCPDTPASEVPPT
jgi:hypothetical protein